MRPMPADTEQLIHLLTRRVPRVARHAVLQRIACGLLGGGLLTLVIVLFGLHVRADLATAVQSFSFWMKALYSLSLMGCAVWATMRLARPTEVSWRYLRPVFLPVLLWSGIAIGELAATPAKDWLALWLGHSWKVCPWIVLGLSIPIYLGLLWSFRALAPTQLRAAGAAAGLSAGAWAATLYGLHCPETTALFTLTWYSLGVLLASLGGALLGTKLLRW